MIMLINHNLNQPLINKIVKIVNLSFIQINGNFLKSSLEKFTEMRYDVVACMCRVRHNRPRWPSADWWVVNTMMMIMMNIKTSHGLAGN
jgi:hypothetical protein